MFHGVECPCELIFKLLGIQEKRFWRRRRSEVLSRQMAPGTHNRHSRRLKKRLCWCRWSVISRCRKVMRIHFFRPGHIVKWLGRSRWSDVSVMEMDLWTHNMRSGRLKKRLWWSWWRYVSGWRKAMRTHFLHIGHPKSALDEVAEVMFWVGECPWDFIICLLEVLRFDFGEVVKALFKGDERMCHLIFCFPGIQKSNLNEVADVKFYVREWPWELFICFLDVL
jgi:hypothetical protein